MRVRLVSSRKSSSLVRTISTPHRDRPGKQMITGHQSILCPELGTRVSQVNKMWVVPVLEGITFWLRRAIAHVTCGQVYRQGSPSGGAEGDVGIRIYL